MCWRDEVVTERTCLACGNRYTGSLGHSGCPEMEKMLRKTSSPSSSHPTTKRSFLKYTPGTPVEVCCIHKDCGGKKVTAVLGTSDHIPFFGSAHGHPEWKMVESYEGFHLQKGVRCPGCKTYYSGVVILSRGPGHHHQAFGVEPEPA